MVDLSHLDAGGMKPFNLWIAPPHWGHDEEDV
jgi:hypothetical protein